MVCLLAVAICASTLPAMAGTAYDNMGSPPSYQCCTGWTVGGASSQVGLVEDAELFTSLVSGNVNEIDVALGWVNGQNGATVSLWTDSGGAPGTELFSAAVSNQPTFGSTGSIITSVAVSGVSITAGDNYFVVIEGDSTTWDAWNWSNSATGQLDQNSGSGWNQFADQPTGGMTVLTGGAGTTPEPSSLLLLGTGLVGAFGAIRRKLNR